MKCDPANEELPQSNHECGDEPTVIPRTYIVLQLSPNVSSSVVKWLVDKIRGKRRYGGAELMVFRQPHAPNEVSKSNEFSCLSYSIWPQMKSLARLLHCCPNSGGELHML